MKHPNAQIEAYLAKLASPMLATIDLSLNRITALLAALGNPQERVPPVVHVAGTNGKGSLIAYLIAIMQAAGYRVHRYISPHLIRFNERIVINDHEISDEYLLALLAGMDGAIAAHPVTFFEATTALAFLAFADTPADIVLLETGLGGRLDATNMVRAPKVTAITPVSLDHTEYLGSTIASIAGEKAGIIKAGAPCIVGSQLPEAARVIEQAAQRLHAPLYRFGQEWQVERESSGFHYRSQKGEKFFPFPTLSGEHQIENAGMAIACIEQLRGFSITDEHIAQGLKGAHWPARLERLMAGNLAGLLPLGSELWLDGGHNPGAGEILGQWVKAQSKPVHIICGMLKNKDVRQFLASLAPHIQSLTAIAIEDEPQSQKPEVIAGIANTLGIKKVLYDPTNDIKKSIEVIVNININDFIILICGSLYLAGNILWQNSRAS